MKQLQFAKVREVKTPIISTDGSAGIDFFIPEKYNETKILGPGDSVLIPSGIHVKIPNGFALIAFNKSGISTKKNLMVGACVIDSDYQGEIHIHLINCGNKHKAINPGEKIIQFILMETPKVEIRECPKLSDLYTEETERGKDGFGSTN